MSKAFILGLVSLAMAFGCAGSRTQDIQEKKADIYFTSGSEALLKGDYTEALGSLQEAVKYNPKSAGIWTNLGLAYAGKEEFTRAEECFKRALVLDPKWSDARANLGVFYIKQNRLAEGERQLKEVTKDLIYPQMANVHFNLSLIYSEWHKTQLAEQHLKLATKANAAFCPAWFRLGLMQKERGDFEMAAASFTKSVAGVCFNNPQAHYEISSLLVKSRDLPRARAKLLEIIQLFPQSDWAAKAEVTLNMIR